MVSLAAKKREDKDNKAETIDSRVALYLPRSSGSPWSWLQRRGVGLNKLLRELIRRGQETLEEEGRNNE